MKRHRFITASIVLALAAQSGLAAAQIPKPATALTPEQVMRINRATWGVTTASLRQPGAALEQPTTVPAKMPPAVERQIAQMRISRETLAQIFLDFDAKKKMFLSIKDPVEKRAAMDAYYHEMNDLTNQAAKRSILRDIYSPDQLRENITWFWFNHFTVFKYKTETGAMIGDYEDKLRNHAFGHFRDILEVTLRHPAMLLYLDNSQNAVGHINENYAREILELHAMGVGSGYSQKDVQELARILTGVSFRTDNGQPHMSAALQSRYIRDGMFEFDPTRHDFGTKHFLGHTIEGTGYGEVKQALDLIATSTATARHVSQQLATYFIGAPPSPALVATMTAAWQRSNGDIATVLRAMFQSPEYRASLGHGFKDPMHYVISAIRFAYDDQVIDNVDPILNWLNRMGEGLYAHQTPEGYSMAASAWASPGQMETRMEFALMIGHGAPGLFTPPTATPNTPSPSPHLQNALYAQSFDHALSPGTRRALGQAKNPAQWNMLFLASPEFMRR